jgi:hypothetical protein
MIEQAQKALYATIGAPVVVTRKLRDLSGRVGGDVVEQLELWVKEGEKVTKQIRNRDVMEEISGLVDLEQLQGRVERLRDQLEDVLENWRENFRPEPVKAPAPMATKKAPATKAPARKPVAKKAPARKPAAKPAAKKAPAKKAPAKNASASNPAATK